MPNTKHNFNSMIVINALYGMFWILRSFPRNSCESIDRFKIKFSNEEFITHFLQLLFFDGYVYFRNNKKYFRKNKNK